MTVLAICLVAFGLRLAIRIHLGEEYFWNNGYSFYYGIATNLATGKGLYWEELGPRWVFRVPVYPAFLALTTFFGKSYLLIVIPQAAFGAGTAFCTFLIGRELFNARAGIIAAGIAAIYPYYLMHDTALQETGLYAFLATLAVFLLLRAIRSAKSLDWIVAGCALGLAVLTRVTLLPFGGLACLWILCFAPVPRRRQAFLLLAVSFSLTIAPWLIRSWVLLGRPIFTSESGRNLWDGNNAQTFSSFPEGSIDVSDQRALEALDSGQRAELERIRNDELRQNDWFTELAVKFIRAHPWQIVRGAFLKLTTAFSWRLSPRREWPVQLAYLLSYGPVSILGGLGMLANRRNWRIHGVIYLLFLCFIAETMVFFAHTSHRMYLDVYLIVFAGFTLDLILSKLGIRVAGESTKVNPMMLPAVKPKLQHY